MNFLFQCISRYFGKYYENSSKTDSKFKNVVNVYNTSIIQEALGEMQNHISLASDIVLADTIGSLFFVCLGELTCFIFAWDKDGRKQKIASWLSSEYI